MKALCLLKVLKERNPESDRNAGTNTICLRDANKKL